MSKEKNNSQNEKRVSAQSETRFTFPTPDELILARQNARTTLEYTVQYRWAKFVAAQQVFRRKQEAQSRAGEAPTLTHAFWYQNDSHITAMLYLAHYTLADKIVSPSSLQADLGMSLPFIRKLHREAVEGGFMTKNYKLTDVSIEMYFDRVKPLLELQELRDFADALHTSNVVNSKNVDIEKNN
tara:strand:+ start:32 stop:583 length:552 start_codon:yes stop_codon:yes gene_type:complete